MSKTGADGKVRLHTRLLNGRSFLARNIFGAISRVELPFLGGKSLTYLRSVLTETNASAVLFDLCDLRYTWGDAICGLALELKKNDGSFRPSAIVARGQITLTYRGHQEAQSG